MIWRIRYQKLGGHYHCRFFVAPRPNTTFTKLGDFILGENEWAEFYAKMLQVSIEVLPEEPKQFSMVDKPLSPPRPAPKPSAAKKTRGRKSEVEND